MICRAAFFLPFLFRLSNQQLTSPCPKIFNYDVTASSPGKWYGNITSEKNLSKAVLRISLNQPALQLGNWFGPVTILNSKEYLVEDATSKETRLVRFYVKYKPEERLPELAALAIDGVRVCPEIKATELTTTTTARTTAVNSTIDLASSTFDSEQSIQNRFSNVNELTPPLINNNSFDTLSMNGSNTTTNFAVGSRSSAATIIDTESCGTVTSGENEFPWNAAIYYVLNSGINFPYTCGGTLITKNHVLTTAGCVIPRDVALAVATPDKFHIYLGKKQLGEFTSPEIQVRQASQVVLHPNYSPQNFANNIAVLKFTDPVHVTPFVRPICLWQEGSSLNSLLNVNGKVVGWGVDPTKSENLVAADMDVVTQDTCRFSFPVLYGRLTSSKTYCAGYKNGTATCYGSLGGGMYFPHSNSTSTWQVRGLMSVFIPKSGGDCQSGNYVVFTDVAKYLKWIAKETV